MEKMKPFKMPKHDYSALRNRIVEQYGNECSFAQEIGLNKSQLSNRFTGKSPMHPCEIYRICDVLEIPYEEIPSYFHVYETKAPIKKGLRKVIKEQYKSEVAFASTIGMTPRQMSLRLNFEVDFRHKELCTIAQHLGITITEVNLLLDTERELANGQECG